MGDSAPLLASLFQFNIWSFAVPAAIISGYWFALRRAKQAGLPKGELESAIWWAIGAGLIISHIVEVLLYKPHLLETDGILTLVKFWEGLSSYGGFVGGVAGLVFFYARKKKRWWPEADILIQGMIVAWIFGRFGCTISGDHPGPLTDLPFAYPYEEGARHNMGLYEFLITLLILFPANLLLHRYKPPVGAFVAMNCMAYGVFRFALDFMRATDIPYEDPRYGGLTLAHYCAIATFLFGLWVFFRMKQGQLARSEPPPPPAATPEQK